MHTGSRPSTIASIRVPRRGRGLRRVGLVLAAGLLALWGEEGASRAELVVLADQRVIKVTGFERRGDKMELSLPVGGTLLLPLARIERIVDDEIVDTLEFDDRMPIEFAFDGEARVPDTPFGRTIFAAAERHSVNPEIVAAVIAVESAFDADAVSSKGAMGLMQLMPATAERFGVEAGRAFDPETNIGAGVRYLRWLSERFPEDLPKVLAAYNAGEGNVERYDGVPPFRETQRYVRKVYSRLGFDFDTELGAGLK